MIFKVNDDGVVSSVDEENLIYVDRNELEQFIESYQELEKENEQLKKLFYEMLIQTNVKIDPKKPTRYSATLIFNAEEYLTVMEIMKDFKR